MKYEKYGRKKMWKVGKLRMKERESGKWFMCTGKS